MLVRRGHRYDSADILAVHRSAGVVQERDPQWRFVSADAMRAALEGRSDRPGVPRPPTRVLSVPLPDPATVMVAPQVRRSWTRALLGLAAALVAVVVAAAVIADSTSRAPAPQPAGTSTMSVPTAVTTSVVPPPPTTPAQLDQGQPRKGRGENGNGNRKPKGEQDDD